MNLAAPAPRVEPATAEVAVAPESLNEDNEYKVEPAPNVSDRYDVETHKVEPAVLDDPRKFAPNEQLNEPHRDPALDIPVEKLRESNSGIAFEGPAGLSKGIHMTCSRRILPCLYDERDFTSYGEILRYIVVKDGYCFIYGEKSDPSPLYNIPIESLKPFLEDPNKPHKTSITVSPSPNTNLQGDGLETVLLLDAMGDLAYQFTFEVNTDGDIAKRFIGAIEKANIVGKSRDKAQSKVV